MFTIVPRLLKLRLTESFRRIEDCHGRVVKHLFFNVIEFKPCTITGKTRKCVFNIRRRSFELNFRSNRRFRLKYIYNRYLYRVNNNIDRC